MLSNRKFVQHEVARQQRIYEKSIRNAKPHPDIASLDFNDPIKCPKNRRKELMLESIIMCNKYKIIGRNREIEFENEVMQRHLLDIKKHESARPPKSPLGFKPKSMNVTRRKAEYDKINRENAMFLKELQSVKPMYSYKEDMKNYKQTKKYLEVSSARGYNPYLVVHKKQQQSPRSLPPLSPRKDENCQNVQPPKDNKSKAYKRKVHQVKKIENEKNENTEKIEEELPKETNKQQKEEDVEVEKPNNEDNKNDKVTEDDNNETNDNVKEEEDIKDEEENEEEKHEDIEKPETEANETSNE